MSSSPSIPQFVGVIVEVTSYSTAKAIVLRTTGYTSLVTYGSLAVVKDSEDPSIEYLATVTDVREKGILPAIDRAALERVMEEIMMASNVDVKKAVDALREIVFPGVQREFGVREVDLYIVGVMKRDPKGNIRVELHQRPPRPYSTVEEASAGLINSLLARDCGQMVLGGHLVIPGALVTLDPGKLNMHLAVVGQTGSGKTETVKRIALEYYARSQQKVQTSLIVFDVAGEYLGYPYKSGKKTLLEALLDPQKVICEPRPSCANVAANAVKPPRITVLVPYSLSKIGPRKATEAVYFSRYRGLVSYYRSTTGATATGSPDNILFGRHGVYTIDQGGNLLEIGLADAWHAVENTDSLLVAAPLPDSLSIDEIVELSGTSSEYAPVLIRSLAGALALTEFEEVQGLTLVHEVLEIRRYIAERVSSKKSGHGNVMKSFAHILVQRIQSDASSGNKMTLGRLAVHVKCALLEALEGKGACQDKNALRKVDVFISPYAWLYYITLPLWKEWDPSARVQKPFDPQDPAVILQALAAQDLETGRPWRESIIDRFAAAGWIRVGLSETINAALRALRKVRGHVSPVLNPDLYGDLVERLLGAGATFVLLAPPSTGASELPVARLIEKTFDHAIASYDPSRPKRTLMIVEEAHNLAPSRGDPPTKPGLLRIAREGRKWGIGLVLVTQRPGFVDPDVLSQATTLIALRITNPEDISGLKRSVESVTAEAATRLPDLDPGNAVVSGLALPERRIPILARITMLGGKCP